MRTKAQLIKASIPSIKLKLRSELSWNGLLEILLHLPEPQREIMLRDIYFNENHKIGKDLAVAVDHDITHRAEHLAFHIFEDDNITVSEADLIL